MIPGRFSDVKSFKNLSSKIFDFCKILKNPKKIFLRVLSPGKSIFNSRTFYCFVLFCTKRICSNPFSNITCKPSENAN